MSSMTPSILYHATGLINLASLREHGLSGSLTRVRPGFIHLASDLAHAKAYAFHWDEAPSLILSVDCAHLAPTSLGPDREDLAEILDSLSDERSWDEVPWKESLALSGQCVYAGVIPARHVRVVGLLMPSGEFSACDVPLADYEPPLATRPNKP